MRPTNNPRLGGRGNYQHHQHGQQHSRWHQSPVCLHHTYGCAACHVCSSPPTSSRAQCVPLLLNGQHQGSYCIALSWNVALHMSHSQSASYVGVSAHTTRDIESFVHVGRVSVNAGSFRLGIHRARLPPVDTICIQHQYVLASSPLVV